MIKYEQTLASLIKSVSDLKSLKKENKSIYFTPDNIENISSDPSAEVVYFGDVKWIEPPDSSSVEIALNNEKIDDGKIYNWQAVLLKKFDEKYFISDGIDAIAFNGEGSYKENLAIKLDTGDTLIPYASKSILYLNKVKINNEEVKLGDSNGRLHYFSTAKNDKREPTIKDYRETYEYLSDVKNLDDCYLEGFRVSLMESNETGNAPQFSNLVSTKGNITQIQFIFKSDIIEQDNIRYILRFAPDATKYFFPTLDTWENDKEKKCTVLSKIKINVFKNAKGENNLKDIAKSDGNSQYQVSVFFENSKQYKFKDLKKLAIGIYTNQQPQAVSVSDKWADSYGSRGEILRNGNSNDYVHYNIILRDEENNVIEQFSTNSFIGSIPYISSTNGYSKFYYTVNNQKLNTKLNEKIKPGTNLYNIKAKLNSPIKYINGHFEGYNSFLKGTSTDKLTDCMLTSAGVNKYLSYLEFKDHFFTDSNGIVKCGYEHKRSNDPNNEIWNEFSQKASKAGYTVETDNNKNFILKRDGSIVPLISVMYNNAVISVNRSKLQSFASKDTKQVFLRAFNDTFAVWCNFSRKNGEDDESFIYRWYSNEDGNFIRENITQAQYEAIIISYALSDQRARNELVKGINNSTNYEDFCKKAAATLRYDYSGGCDPMSDFKKDSASLFETVLASSSSKKVATYKVSSIEISCVPEMAVMIKSVFKSNSEKWWQAYSDINRDVLMYIVPTEAANSGVEVKLSAAKLAFGAELEFINFWSARRAAKDGKDNSDKIEQELYGVDRYYDVYSGMTPYVEVSFRGEKLQGNKGYTWNKIDSINYPYIKSLDVDDVGVKTVELVLYDKDFGSYQNGITVSGKYNSKKIYSLETLIKQALKADLSDGKKEETEGETYDEYTADETDLKSDYIKFSEYDDNINTAENLKIRFGYCDCNQPNSGEKIKNYFSKKGSPNRTHRWYDVLNNDAEKNFRLETEFSLKGEQLNKDGKMILCNSPEEIVATDNQEDHISESEKINKGRDMTTAMSYQISYMIIGYSSTLKNNGIEYHIKAIETSNAVLHKKRFLQRYSEINGCPLECLYVLMRIFNENDNGELTKNAPRILLLNDMPEQATDGFNMLVDTSSMEKSEAANFADLNTVGRNDNIEIDPTKLKKISIKLGGEESLRNYLKTKDSPPLYKSVASLLDEFCAACPPRKIKRLFEGEKENKSYDNDGNEIVKEESSISAPLRWLVARSVGEDNKADVNDSNLYIILYYRMPTKLKHIREYTYGPGNPYQTVIKNISIQNKNEFAVFAGISSFVQGATGIIKSSTANPENINTEGTTTATYDSSKLNAEFESGAIKSATVVGSENTVTGDAYQQAYNSSMYSGSIEILGDPSLQFSTLLQPYTYPIKLDVILPRNEMELKGKNAAEMNNVNKRYGTKQNVGLSKLHETSRYYVITKIHHSLSASGFKTTLEVASYPRIEFDILEDPTKELNSAYFKE